MSASETQNQTALDWSDWDAETAGFKCETGVGTEVIIGNGYGSHDMWLSWNETVALYRWLGKKVERMFMTNPPDQIAGLPIPKLHWGSRCITRCQADEDDYCGWPDCPQIRDDEPRRSGRHCPWDVTDD